MCKPLPIDKAAETQRLLASLRVARRQLGNPKPRLGEDYLRGLESPRSLREAVERMIWRRVRARAIDQTRKSMATNNNQ